MGTGVGFLGELSLQVLNTPNLTRSRTTWLRSRIPLNVGCGTQRWFGTANVKRHWRLRGAGLHGQSFAPSCSRAEREPVAGIEVSVPPLLLECHGEIQNEGKGRAGLPHHPLPAFSVFLPRDILSWIS